MTEIKKAPRKKSYKNMSVGELVAARKELSTKIEQIDIILNQAVEAVGSLKLSKGTNVGRRSYASDPAFVPSLSAPSDYLNAQVAISKEAPILSPISRTAADQSSGFSIFDAEAAAREQTMMEEEYIRNNTDVVTEDNFDFNNEEVSKEIESLRSNIQSSLENN
jgi:hypothetical protein